jgi:Spy/CpxP family protein refolding chaperone
MKGAMIMFKRLSVAAMAMAIVIGLAATTAHAWDDYRGRWWRTPDVVQQLNLTNSEIDQLDKAFDAARIQMIELKGKVEIERSKLRTLMEQSDFNEAEVREQHRTEEAARTQLADARFGFLLKVREIIGQDRFLKLLDIRAARWKQHHHQKAENQGK